MKKFKVDYMINHELETETVEANSSTEAIAKMNDRLKAMQVSFVIYGAR
ncbi:MAG: hypothetical protein Q4F05_11310 [bacterium]|nr:hypothetical protein [bacterium]